MERYELKVKYEEIRELTEQERYEDAAEICNTIDWDRSKNINMLCTAGEVYERCGLLADSKAIYLRAYQLQPQSRIVIYRLAELSIKLRDYEDSIHFYKLYEDAAPYDVNLYVLRYKIYRARGASKDVLISILEELKENDYHERWAYELAKLYSEAGLTEKCVAECDEIDLWFGSGRYVRQALQLKKRYQPLTERQQRKLDDAAPKPHRAEETLKSRAIAEEKQRKAQETYGELQAQTKENSQAKEQARKQALDAAREARAAQLLAEAEEEKEAEDKAQAEKDGAEFYGHGVFPQLEIPEAPAAKTDAAKSSKEDPAHMITLQKPTEAKDAKEALAENSSKEGFDPAAADISGEKSADGSALAEKQPKMTENDILAENIARILGGKAPLTEAELRGEKPQEEQQTYEDDDAPDASDTYGEVDEYDDADLNENARGEEDADTQDTKETDGADKKRASLVGAATGIWEKVTDEEDTFIDDYEMENPPEDDSDVFEEDDEAFAKKESAFHKMWRMTSGVVGKKAKNTTKIAEEQEYDIQIRPVVVSRYDTLNLQKELAKGIRAIMNATETEEVEKTMKNMNRSMEASNIPRLIQTKRLNIQEVKEELEREEAEKENARPADGATLVQEAAALDDRMQRMLGEEYDGQIRLMLEKETIEKQITGQMSIADMFQSEEERNLAAAKKKALEQTEEYIDQLSVVVPLIDEYGEMVIEEDVTEANAPAEASPVRDETVREAQDILQETSLKNRADIRQMIADLSDLLKKSEEPADSPEEELDMNIAEVAAEEELAADVEEAAAEEELAADVTEVANEMKKILSYFMKFDGVEGEITAFMEREKDNGESFAIVGTEGSGRLSLALRLMKVVIRSTPGTPKRIAKLPAETLNEKSIASVFAKLDKGTLIVEQAQKLNRQAISELTQVMDAYAQAVRVILIGEPEELGKIFEENPTLESYFTYTFHLHDYSNDELVEFAKTYADTKGYRIDEVAVLALYTRLAEAKNAQQAVMLGDVKAIVDGAIEKSRSVKGVKRLFENLLMKNVDDDGNLLLREQDFEPIQADS